MADLVESVLAPSREELLEREIRLFQQKLKLAKREAGDLHEKLQAMMGLGRPVATEIRPSPSSGGTAGVAIMVASDWHVEEIVKPEAVNGLNEYDPYIAKRRAEAFFVGAARLRDILSRDMDIQHTVLCLLGDFITNDLHDDSAENNAMRPMEAAMFAQDLLASGIEYLLRADHAPLVVVCHTGNHGRTTRRVHHAQEHGHSIEFMMYHSLARAFKGNNRVSFIIPEGYHSYLDIFGVTVRFHHGHKMNYYGGVGGITIPVNKAVAEWDKGRRADLDLFGHFHQYLDGGKFLANGSLIGYNAYALSIKASPEPPRQAFTIVDERRGRTWTTPIYVDEKPKTETSCGADRS